LKYLPKPLLRFLIFRKLQMQAVSILSICGRFDLGSSSPETPRCNHRKISLQEEIIIIIVIEDSLGGW